MQEENTSQKTPKKTWKYILLLFIGIFLTIIAIENETGNLSKYNLPVVIGYILCYLLLCFFGLGLIALIASQRMGDVKRYWLPVFVWLFLIVFFFDIVIKTSNKFVLQRNIDKLRYLMNSSSAPSELEASGPIPPDGAIHKDIWVNLSWPYGKSAVSYDVYLGDNFDDVNASAESTFQGNQIATFFVVGFPRFPYPDGLFPGTTYYWRIDEVNDTEPNSPWKGDVWSFSIPRMPDYFPDQSYDTKSKDTVKKADKNSP